jgi:hypothetical protein
VPAIPVLSSTVAPAAFEGLDRDLAEHPLLGKLLGADGYLQTREVDLLPGLAAANVATAPGAAPAAAPHRDDSENDDP